MSSKQKSTTTSSFGSAGRSNHDSTSFYAGGLYRGVKRVSDDDAPATCVLPEAAVNQIFCASSETMTAIPDCCVHLAVTSPPYNVGKKYDNDLTLDEYRDFLRRVFSDVYRVLVPGGRLCVNVANLGRSPYIPLTAYLTVDLGELGYLMRGEVIWDKGGSAGSSTAWGSWCSPANPTLRDVHEYILVFSKQKFGRTLAGSSSTLSRDEFLEVTKSIWRFPTERATRVGHPAPFPVELPRRCMQLYSAKGDVVLDPFMGVGATAVAAVRTGRLFVGYDIDAGYCEAARRRIATEPVESLGGAVC